MSFSTVVGLDHAARPLQKALTQGRLPGCYLLVGPQGVGKTTLALALARAVACTNPVLDPFDACDQCNSCKRSASGNHPEIVTISPAGETTQIWQFWDRDGKPQGVLQHSLNFAPTVGRKRVYIIERADTLTEGAANSLLKALEETPHYALFVLLTPHAARMLPTILSRSQIIRVSPSGTEPVVNYLSKVLGLEQDPAQVIAAYAQGRIGTARRLAEDANAMSEIERAVELASALAFASPMYALKLSEEIRKFATSLKGLLEQDAKVADKQADAGEPGAKEKAGRKQVGTVVDLLTLVYRDLLALSLGSGNVPIVHTAFRDKLTPVATKSEPGRWVNSLETLLSARRRVDQNASLNLLTDWLALSLASA